MRARNPQHNRLSRIAARALTVQPHVLWSILADLAAPSKPPSTAKRTSPHAPQFISTNLGGGIFRDGDGLFSLTSLREDLAESRVWIAIPHDTPNLPLVVKGYSMFMAAVASSQSVRLRWIDLSVTLLDAQVAHLARVVGEILSPSHFHPWTYDVRIRARLLQFLDNPAAREGMISPDLARQPRVRDFLEYFRDRSMLQAILPSGSKHSLYELLRIAPQRISDACPRDLRRPRRSGNNHSADAADIPHAA